MTSSNDYARVVPIWPTLVQGPAVKLGKDRGKIRYNLAEDIHGETSTLVIVQSLRPDRFFNVEHQQRLAELMDRWRTARDKGETLPSDEEAEPEALVEAELPASADRTTALADELKP